jgi:hypothetical protein
MDKFPQEGGGGEGRASRRLKIESAGDKILRAYIEDSAKDEKEE